VEMKISCDEEIPPASEVTITSLFGSPVTMKNVVKLCVVFLPVARRDTVVNTRCACSR
jgi:hypothetical protein